jgi:hypothetical protein
MLIERQTDASRLNEIVNHPDIYPWVRGTVEGPLDMSAAIENEDVLSLLGEHGGVTFHRLMPSLWEAHTAITPEGRGEWGLRCVQECLKWLFCRTDAMEAMTRCPHGNLPAKALARAIHGTFECTNQNAWMLGDKVVPVDIYALRIQDWVRLAPELEESGARFHDKLKSEFDRLGIAYALNNDPAHNRRFGAAYEMFLGGQPHKGAVLFNRFASMTGCQPIHVVSTHPFVSVSIQSALLVIKNDDFFVVSPPN